MNQFNKNILFTCLLLIIGNNIVNGEVETHSYIFSRPLEIGAESGYYRYKIQIVDNSETINFRQLSLIRQLFTYSGVFSIEKNPLIVELKLDITDSQFFGVNFRLLTINEKVIVEDNIRISESNKDLQEKIIGFIDKVILAIDGEKSLFNSAIAYSEEGVRGTKNIVLTGFLGNERVTIVRNGLINILPNWSPDGSKLVYTSIGLSGTRVNIIDFDTFKSRPIQPTFGPTTGGSFIDNDQIVVTQSIGGKSSLYIYHLYNKSWKRIFNNPFIATNGRVYKDKLLFTSNRSRGVHIFIKNNYLENGNETRLTFFGNNNSEPNWNNNGKLILFSSYIQDLSQLFLISNDGINIRQLTFESNGAEQAVWSNDNRQILFATTKKVPQRLIFISLDGNFKRYLFPNDFPSQSNPAWTNKFDWSTISKFTN